MEVKQRVKQLLGREGSLGCRKRGSDLGVGARSVLILSNGDPKHFPSHGSVAFHTYSSSTVPIIGLMVDSVNV